MVNDNDNRRPTPLDDSTFDGAVWHPIDGIVFHDGGTDSAYAVAFHPYAPWVEVAYDDEARVVYPVGVIRRVVMRNPEGEPSTAPDGHHPPPGR